MQNTYIHTSIQHMYTTHTLMHVHTYTHSCIYTYMQHMYINSTHTRTCTHMHSTHIHMCAQHTHAHIQHTHIYTYTTYSTYTYTTHPYTYTHTHNTHLYKHPSQEWVKEAHHKIKCLRKQDEALGIEPDSADSPALLGSYGDGQQSLGDPQPVGKELSGHSCGY